MARRDIGPHGLALIKSYEAFYPYVYDDKAPLVNGRSPEYRGGPVRGTLTIGYGHTDAARHPLKCTVGQRVSEAEAIEILHVDMSECVEAVNAAVKVPTTQGQSDALYSFTFNCGRKNLCSLVVPLNRGDYDTTRADFGHYIRSKGEVMRGLERRRHAEQVLWDDRYEEVDLPPEDPQTPKNVDDRPARHAPPPAKHVTPIAIGTATAGAGEVLTQVNSTLDSAKHAKTSLSELMEGVALSPGVLLALALVVGVAVLWFSHNRKG